MASAVALLAGVIALRVFGPWMLRDFTALSSGLLRETWPADITPEALTDKLAGISLHILRLLLPLMACCCVGAVAANLLQSGFLFSTAPIVPDFNRINPFQGLQRMFSLRGLADLIKPLLKFSLLALVAYHYLRSQLPLLTSLSATGGMQAMGEIARVIWTLLMRIACAMLLVAAVDYLFQRHLHEKSLRMTHQDLKEEFRRSEGDPLVKARLRRLMQQLARGRMLQQVARATVVVTNPTHLAGRVALRPGGIPRARRARERRAFDRGAHQSQSLRASHPGGGEPAPRPRPLPRLRTGPADSCRPLSGRRRNHCLRLSSRGR